MEVLSSCVMVDDSGRIRLLNPSEFSRSREIAQTSKQILDQLVALEIASRPQRLKAQREEIARLQEELDRLITEYESLATVRREQELLLAQLTYTNAST
ncbi:hypothetical protein GOP47_0000306 [Adiantum capillus-veneris]|uniref:Uncharacterized protein n=1 Tax=Adiantum capillus-veneris TaxID=13818 RepID=A0A9D4VDB1_ADICA|nr:hypothetical protein GOP47_0000306 [Adiantum capillus-veneris]